MTIITRQTVENNWTYSGLTCDSRGLMLKVPQYRWRGTGAYNKPIESGSMPYGCSAKEDTVCLINT